MIIVAIIIAIVWLVNTIELEYIKSRTIFKGMIGMSRWNGWFNDNDKSDRFAVFAMHHF